MSNGHPAQLKILHTYQRWRGEALINLPVEANGSRIGFLLLGSLISGQPYTQREYQLLKRISEQTAQAIELSQRIGNMNLKLTE